MHPTRLPRLYLPARCPMTTTEHLVPEPPPIGRWDHVGYHHGITITRPRTARQAFVEWLQFWQRI